MLITLETVAGPHAKEKILLRDGQVAQVGRTEWADFAFPRDGHMSGLHFALRCEQGTCEVRDLGSSNGTYLNGKKVPRAMLGDGDEIRAGQSVFSVHVEGISSPDAEIPPAAAVPVDPSRPYDAALADDEPGVRREAMMAAAWAGRKWLLDYCRNLCDRPSPDHFDAILLAAILGEPEDIERISALAQAESLSPRRFEVFGAYGHPAVVPLLLGGIGSDDPPAVVAAGRAFTKLTGAQIDSDETVELPGEEESETLLPSLELARSHWAEVKNRFAHSTRVCCGLDLGKETTEEILSELDLRSRREACLRGSFHGTRQGSPVELERFPQGSG